MQITVVMDTAPPAPQTTMGSFNGLLRDFVAEMSQTFPESTELSEYATKLETVCVKYPEKPMKSFVKALGPHAEMVTSKNPALFSEGVHILGGFCLDALASEDVSDQTREAVWQYLGTLYLLGSTIASIPPDLMAGIESVAQDLAAKVSSGEVKMEDMFAQMTQTMLGGGNSPFGDLSKLLK
jgi:hypothetical protein